MPKTASPARLADSTRLELIKSIKPAYPAEAAEKGIQGQVVVKMLISETGEVESAEIISGDPILAQAALEAVKRWRFKPYVKNGHAVKVVTKTPLDFAFTGKIIDRKPPEGTADIAGAPSGTDSGNSELPQRVRVSQGVSQGMLLHQVAPVYPPAARQARIEGSVILRAVIGKDGTLHELTPVSGPPELVPAAVGAVQQWRYKPYLLKGEPVEVETQITVNFQLR